MSHERAESGMTEPASSSGEPSEQKASARSAQEIQSWIVDYLARILEKPADAIDVTVPFDDFALDSATAIGMTGDLEEWLGESVDPTLVFDYPTIEKISTYLANPN